MSPLLKERNQQQPGCDMYIIYYTQVMILVFLQVLGLFGKLNNMKGVEVLCKSLSAYKIHPFIQQTCFEFVCYDRCQALGGGMQA